MAYLSTFKNLTAAISAAVGAAALLLDPPPPAAECSRGDTEDEAPRRPICDQNRGVTATGGYTAVGSMLIHRDTQQTSESAIEI
jgi:hypothetical protein